MPVAAIGALTDFVLPCPIFRGELANQTKMGSLFYLLALTIHSLTGWNLVGKELTLWGWQVKRKTLTEEAPAPGAAPAPVK